ncbi:MAG: HU family DNA-binding protein [Treponemataceae bacterium]|nr:HU family DNA-binding protein [Treponemataceae bacterium]
MAIPFVSRKRLNPRDMDAEGKFYPAPAYISEIDIHQLAEEISENTTLTPTEVLGVISSLLRTLPKYLLLGYKVRLNSFGIFKVGLKVNPQCSGYERATEVTANDIEGVRVMFTPDIMLKRKLEKPAYVKLDARYLTDDSGEEVPVPSEVPADFPGNSAESA